MHSLPVFSSIEKLQNLYGLKHQDYKRYGQYCSRKLARTRKSLNFTQQSNKSKFTHKVVDHQIAQEDLRYITIPLFAAERAWSCAMQIKQDTNVQDSTRPLVHLRKKLAKAARLAQEFETICAQVADPKTVLEAQAYAALMAAYSNLESKKLKAALEKFVRAQTVLESLLKIAASDDRAIFNSRIEQIKTNIRYCEYFEGKADGAVLKSQMKDVDDILKAKVDAVLGETSKSDDSSRSINWGGNAILLKNQRINLMILKSEELDLKYNESKANSPEEESENLLNELIVCYSEIESMVRSEISQLVCFFSVDITFLRVF
jgi:signal recognition particle subunit SRP68